MKRIKFPTYWIGGIILSLTLCLSSFRMTTPQQDQLGLARVNQMQGKYVYVMYTPVQEYEEVGKINTALSDFAGMEKDIRQSVKEMIKKGIKKEKSGKIEAFDDVITEDGAVGVLIKFQ